MNNPSIAAAAFSAAESVASQPSLFDANEIPLDIGIGRAAARLAHSGQITCRDDAKAMAIAACKLAGLSDKATAAKVGCSRNTIGPVMEHLERAGRIPALQARLAYSLGRVAESSALELQRIVDEGQWTLEASSAVRALGVAMGIATEKLQLVTGQSTAIIEQRIGAAGPEARAEWESKLRQAFGLTLEAEAPGPAPADGQSEASRPILQLNGPSAPLATEFATDSRPLEAHSLEAGDASATRPRPLVRAAAGPGGGGRAAPAPRPGTMPSSE